MNFTIFVDERNFEEYDDSPILNEVCSRLILSNRFDMNFWSVVNKCGLSPALRPVLSPF